MAAEQVVSPADMRARMAEYVAAVHRAYLSQSRLLSPGDQARLPLLVPEGGFTVAVAAAHDLHLIATTDALPAPQGQEVELEASLGSLRWRVRFFDASVLPPLGLVATAGDVAKVIGIGAVIYHLTVSIGSDLSEHHAQHAGVALAHQQMSALRDFAALRAAWHGAPQVDELEVAQRLGLTRAAQLLAEDLGLSDAADLADAASQRAGLLRLARGGRSR